MRRNLKDRFRHWSAAAVFAMGYCATSASCSDETPIPSMATMSALGGSGGSAGVGGAAGSPEGMGGAAGAATARPRWRPNECPLDPVKRVPGVCGCGVPEVDADGDGLRACQEECDLDPNKTAPGECGCGLPDVDSDGDAALDCRDECPRDAATTVAGTCGCGAPDDPPLCLRHRYSFNGTGTTATDSVGGADGLVLNTTLAGDGTVVLAGVDTVQYVDLPNGIVRHPLARARRWRFGPAGRGSVVPGSACSTSAAVIWRRIRRATEPRICSSTPTTAPLLLRAPRSRTDRRLRRGSSRRQRPCPRVCSCTSRSWSTERPGP